MIAVRVPIGVVYVGERRGHVVWLGGMFANSSAFLFSLFASHLMRRAAIVAISPSFP